MLTSATTQSRGPATAYLTRSMLIAAFCFIAIVSYLIARYVVNVSLRTSEWPLIAALLAGGTPLVIELFRRALKLEFGSDLLAGISIVTSIALGQYLAGAVIVLMLSGGEALEEFAGRRASSVLGALAKRMPQIAHRCGPEGVADIALDQVLLGETLVVLPFEICPVDGTVISGRGDMDESFLTGEPYRIAKVSGASVLSGAVNGESALTIRVNKLPVDSRYAKIVRVMEEAELRRPHFRRVADRLGAWYTVFALSIAAGAWVAARDPVRFLAVLVIATPCPLLLAIPVAIIGAISTAAARAIIIRDPGMLERLDSCRTMIFDKTGTLTYGKPALTAITSAPGIEEGTALGLAAGLEQYSKHPLAGAILEEARRRGIDRAPVSEISEKPGAGLTGNVEGSVVEITGRDKALRIDPAAARLVPAPGPGMESVLLIDGRYAATFRFRDVPRSESRPFLDHLAPRHGVSRVILLSGDRQSEVREVARELGVAEALSGKSPEEKVEIVRRETSIAATMFLGDGLNDAPAMQAATVGIAFGQNSDVSAEAADAVILESSLTKVDELIHIARRMKRIALESAVGGMALSIAGMFFAAAGYLPPVAGAVAQEVLDAAAVLNALRASFPSREIRNDMETR